MDAARRAPPREIIQPVSDTLSRKINNGAAEDRADSRRKTIKRRHVALGGAEALAKTGRPNAVVASAHRPPAGAADGAAQREMATGWTVGDASVTPAPPSSTVGADKEPTEELMVKSLNAASRLALANCDGLAALVLANGILAALTARGLLSEDDRNIILDDGLQQLETVRASLPGFEIAIDAARGRLESMLKWHPPQPQKS